MADEPTPMDIVQPEQQTTETSQNASSQSSTTPQQPQPTKIPLQPSHTPSRAIANPPETSPSPSPAHRPPIPQTPGIRATRLNELLSASLTRVLRANNYENFSSCFPTPAKRVPALLQSVHRQLNGKLEENVKKEWEGILEERGVVPGLNELDRLVAEAKTRRERETGMGKQAEVLGVTVKGVAPHTLPANTLYTAHLKTHLQAAHTKLTTSLSETSSQNADLATTVLAQREEIAQLLSQLENVVSDLEGAVESMEGEDGVQGLSRETEGWDEVLDSVGKSGTGNGEAGAATSNGHQTRAKRKSRV